MKILVDEMPESPASCDYSRRFRSSSEEFYGCLFYSKNFCDTRVHRCTDTKECSFFMDIKDAMKTES